MKEPLRLLYTCWFRFTFRFVTFFAKHDKDHECWQSSSHWWTTFPALLWLRCQRFIQRRILCKTTFQGTLKADYKSVFISVSRRWKSLRPGVWSQRKAGVGWHMRQNNVKTSDMTQNVTKSSVGSPYLVLLVDHSPDWRPNIRNPPWKNRLILIPKKTNGEEIALQT